MNAIGNTCQDLILSSDVESASEGGRSDSVLEWMSHLRHSLECKVERIPLRQLRKWRFDDGLNLRHETGRFFSIEGIQVKTNHGNVPQWCQPIINQPEIGFLGFICKKIGGVLHFLVQAKIEPGNVNVVQLSPTLQATKSNYTQIHRGLTPLFLEYFLNENSHKVIVDQLQSEQGARFLKKRNRNVVIEINADVEISAPANYQWLTLGVLKKLLRYDNVVNMDSRTVLASLSLSSHHLSARDAQVFGDDQLKSDLLLSMTADVETVNSMDRIVSWFTNQKMHTDLLVERIPLRDCAGWRVEEYSICNKDNKYFEVIGVDVHVANREVTAWSQPLVRHYEPGIVGLIIKKINGIYHLLIQAKMEPGNFDILEMAPTVQCITGSYLMPEYTVQYLDYVTGDKRGRTIYDSLQSEEGGRFYQEQNRYVVVELGEQDAIDGDPRFIWMTLCQAKELMKFNNYLNVELRSIIASISPI